MHCVCVLLITMLIVAAQSSRCKGMLYGLPLSINCMPSLRRQGGAVQAYRLGNIYPNLPERSPPILWVIYPNVVGYLPPPPQFCW